MKIKENILILGMLWIGLVALSFSWNYAQCLEHVEQTALESSRSFFNQILITRQWNVRHGGVYVKITPETQPNPYLDISLRDISVDSDFKLTRINPAFMTRQISEIAMEQQGIQFHITSLKPIRPANKPFPREEIALKKIAEGTPEVGYFIAEGGDSRFFYMAPLITKKPCLPCHAKQGYEEGDIRGGISVTLPFTMDVPLLPLVIGHIGIALVGLIGLVTGGIYLNRAYDTIKTQAVFDALTGIPNRRSFLESILNEFKRCQRDHAALSIILCDIDNFKLYNDTYGHTSGDICLQKVARAINDSLQRPGDFCARYGGEEFIVILSDTTSEGALQVAERIRKKVVELAISHKKSPPLHLVSLSLGVATTEDTSLISHEDLIRQADTALYDAKAKGRNRVEAYTEI